MAEAGGPIGVKHPAKPWYQLAVLMTVFTFLLTLIAIFVPWSWTDTGNTETIHTYVGLWQNCDVYVDRPLHQYTCRENDVDQVSSVTGGDKKCRGFFVATQVFTIIACVSAFLTLLCAPFVLSRVWSKPWPMVICTLVFAFLAFAGALVAFLMWIVYATRECQAGNALFPVGGFSWGWICVVVAAFTAFLTLLFAYIGLIKFHTFKPFIPHEEPPMYPVVMEAPSPAAVVVEYPQVVRSTTPVPYFPVVTAPQGNTPRATTPQVSTLRR